MDDIEVGNYWDGNADAWTALSRAGYDQSRDLFNTPQFLDILPPVAGLRGLDVGCGEGSNTRLVAQRGAKLTAVDISDKFLEYARQSERENPLGIEYLRASAQQLPFPEASFDFATSFMCLMDVPEPERAISEVARVLKPGGFFQFSICHPCFQTPGWKWVVDETGRRTGIVCSDYFDHVKDGWIDEWTFGATPPELKARYAKFKIPRFDRTLSEWINTLIGAGLTITRLQEPAPSKDDVRQNPGQYDNRIFAWFLHVQCLKAHGKLSVGLMAGPESNR